MKAAKVIIFQTNNRDLTVLQMLGLFRLDAVMDGKVFSFDGFLGFRKVFSWYSKGLLKSLFY